MAACRDLSRGRMTFTFDTFSGLLFFLSYGALFLIVAGRFERANAVKPTDCPMHPGMDECAHRKPRR